MSSLYNSLEVVETLEIDEGSVGLIFGRQASTLRAMKEDTGAKIFVEKRAPPHVIIRGTRMQVDNASRKIRALLDSRRIPQGAWRVNQSRLRLALADLFRRNVSSSQEKEKEKIWSMGSEFSDASTRASTTIPSFGSFPTTYSELSSSPTHSLSVRALAQDYTFLQVWAQCGKPHIASCLLNLDPFTLYCSDEATGELTVSFQPKLYHKEQHDHDVIANLRFLPPPIPHVSKPASLEEDEDKDSVSGLLGVFEEGLERRDDYLTSPRNSDTTSRFFPASSSEVGSVVDTDRLPGLALDKVHVFSPGGRDRSQFPENYSLCSVALHSVECDSGLARLLESGPIGMPKVFDTDYAKFNNSKKTRLNRGRRLAELDSDNDTESSALTPPPGLEENVVPSFRPPTPPFATKPLPSRSPPSYEELDNWSSIASEESFGFSKLWKEKDSDASGISTLKGNLDVTNSSESKILSLGLEGNNFENAWFVWADAHVELFGGDRVGLDHWLQLQEHRHGHGQLSPTQTPLSRGFKRPPGLLTPSDGASSKDRGRVNSVLLSSNAWDALEKEDDAFFSRPSSPARSPAGVENNTEGVAAVVGTDLPSKGKSLSRQASANQKNRSSRYASELDAEEAAGTEFANRRWDWEVTGKNSLSKGSTTLPTSKGSSIIPLRRGSSKGSSRYEENFLSGDNSNNLNNVFEKKPTLTASDGFTYVVPPPPVLPTPSQVSMISAISLIDAHSGFPQHVQKLNAGRTSSSRMSSTNRMSSSILLGDNSTRITTSPFSPLSRQDFGLNYDSPITQFPSNLLEQEALGFRMAAPLSSSLNENEKDELSTSQTAYLEKLGFGGTLKTTLLQQTLKADFTGHGSDRDRTAQLICEKGTRVTVEGGDNKGWSYCCREDATSASERGWLPTSFLE